MLYAGRFISGMCGGAVCVAAPVFTAEICQKEIRGNLGSYYQLLLASGIMFTYLIGGFMSIFWFSIISAMVNKKIPTATSLIYSLIVSSLVWNFIHFLSGHTSVLFNKRTTRESPFIFEILPRCRLRRRTGTMRVG